MSKLNKKKTVREFKKGDKVIFYGATFLITEDAKESEAHETPTFYASCKRICSNDLGAINDLLSNWNYFQSNDLATYEIAG